MTALVAVRALREREGSRKRESKESGCIMLLLGVTTGDWVVN